MNPKMPTEKKKYQDNQETTENKAKKTANANT